MVEWNKDALPRRIAEMSGALDGGVNVSRGLMAGTRVGTSMGWRTVEALQPGDHVLTFDHGMQKLAEVRRTRLRMLQTAELSTVLIPAGAMGNRVDVELFPDQGVLIESDAACDSQGDPFAIVRAKMLAGFRAIRSVAAPDEMEVITLVFDQDEVIYVEGGILLHCPRFMIRLDELGHINPGYQVLSDTEARALMAHLSQYGTDAAYMHGAAA